MITKLIVPVFSYGCEVWSFILRERESTRHKIYCTCRNSVVVVTDTNARWQ
jgi:hypothetical protein